MPTSEGNDKAVALADAAQTVVPKVSAPSTRPGKPAIAKKTKNQNIQVSSAIIAAAGKDGAALFRDLRTSAAGLTQSEAEERARASGPNQVAQEKKQGWPLRVLKIIRNPLVILLSFLSAISFLTGDARHDGGDCACSHSSIACFPGSHCSHGVATSRPHWA